MQEQFHAYDDKYVERTEESDRALADAGFETYAEKEVFCRNLAQAVEKAERSHDQQKQIELAAEQFVTQNEESRRRLGELGISELVQEKAFHQLNNGLLQIETTRSAEVHGANILLLKHLSNLGQKSN